MVNFNNNAKKTILGVLTIGIGLFIYYKFSKVRDRSISKNGVLFVGDSITAIEYDNKPVKTTYSYLIKQELEPKKVKVDVLAVAGKTTDWMLENLTHKLKSNKYDRIYIYGGINDVFSGSNKKTALDNIQKMVNLAEKNNASPFVITGYESKSFMEDKTLKTASKIASKSKYIDFQNSIAKTIKNATIVDEFKIPSSMTSDGIHPSPKGQEIIAKSLLIDLLKHI